MKYIVHDVLPKKFAHEQIELLLLFLILFRLLFDLDMLWYGNDGNRLGNSGIRIAFLPHGRVLVACQMRRHWIAVDCGVEILL